MKIFKDVFCVTFLVFLISSSSVLGHEEDDFEDESHPAGDEFDHIPQEDEKPAEPLKPIERPVYKKPEPSGDVYFTETFESEGDFKKRWVTSKSKKDNTDDAIAKYDGQWSIEEPGEVVLKGDLGLVLKSKAKHAAVSAKLVKPFEFADKPFVVQYEVKFQNGQDCGGAYIKLLSGDNKLDLSKFFDKTPYTVMFGPDKCGNDNKLHFIFRHKNPKSGDFEEKHAKKPTATLDTFFTDKKSHLYTLVISPDNTFEVYVDQNLVNSGSLLADMTPPVNPPMEITDPDDKKPKDWDEREKIPDADAVRPDDWDESEPEMMVDESAEKPSGWLDDEPELVPDPNADKPSDWDDDMDGEWEPAMINNPACESAPGCGEWQPPKTKNPKYKGKWTAPLIDNPNYKGKWMARKIENPDYFEDLQPYKMTTIGAIGLELWSMSDGILFDNFIITDSRKVADQWADDSWVLKHAQELAGSPSGRSVVDAIMDATNERPWLWAVFAIVVVLPLFMLVVYCCMPASKTEEAARRKKTDKPAPDTREPANDDEDDVTPEEQGEEQGEESPPKPESAKKKKSKSSLETDPASETTGSAERKSARQRQKDQ